METESQFKVGTEKYISKRITELKLRKQKLLSTWMDGDIDKESYRTTMESTEKAIQEQEKIYNMMLKQGQIY